MENCERAWRRVIDPDRLWNQFPHYFLSDRPSLVDLTKNRRIIAAV